jgi:hypothetical protein
MGTVFATGTKIAIDCYDFPVVEKPLTVSAEIDYTPQKNTIDLSLEESENIVARLLEKQKQEEKKYENT